MNKYTVYAGIVSISVFAMAAVCLSRSGVVANAFNSIKRSNSPSTEYKLVLNKDNYATTEEVGTWGDSSKETNLATRNTQLGNPIQLKFASGRGVTNNNGSTPDKFCQMPSGYNGWFCNIGSQYKLSGITSIKLTTNATGGKFVFDFSNTVSLDYDYSSTVPSGVYRTPEYTGSNSYSLDLDGRYNFFRLQNLSTSNVGIVSLEVCYNCYEYHEHNESIEYIEHAAVPAFRGVDGNIEYKECPLCHHLFDTDLEEITQEQTVEKSYYYQVVGGNTGDTPEENFIYEAASDAVITVDIYLEDPSLGMRVFFRCNSPWTRTVCARIYGDTFEYTQSISGKPNDGVRYIGQTTDGYYRYEFDLSKMPKEDGFTGVNKIGVYKWQHSAGYLDVNTKGGTLLYGEKYVGGSSKYIDFTERNVAGLTVNVDVFFLTDNTKRVNVCLGNGHDTNNYGYFALWPIVKTGYDYDGVTRSELSNGYIRYSIHLDSVTKKSGSVSTINCLSFKSNWSDATVYISIAFVDNLVHHDEVIPFRGVDGNIEHYTCSECGKYFDSTKVATTQADVERESAFYEFDDTTLPKSSSTRIRYDIPVYKQLDFGDTFVIDFKLEQIGANSEIGFLVGDSDSAYFGVFWIECGNKEYPKLQNNYGTGVTSALTTDNYLRVSVVLDKTKIASGRQHEVDDITKFDYVEILPGTDYSTCTGSLEILPVKGTTTDAIPFIAGKDRTINFPSSSYLKKSTGIVVVDMLIEGSGKAAVMVGNWNNGGTYNGYYDLYSTTKTGDYAGITVSNLDDGFKRFIFDLSALTKGSIIDDTEDYKLLYIRGGWTTASGLVKVTLDSKAASPIVEDIY